MFGMGGMIFVEGLHLVPIVFLLMAAAFSAIDPSLEESALRERRAPAVGRPARDAPARPSGAARGVLLVAIRALEAFEVPALLGIPGGVWVFTSRIWRSLNSYPADLGQAGAYALSLLVVTAIGVFLLSRLADAARRFQTITGRASGSPGARRPRSLAVARRDRRVRVPRRSRSAAAADPASTRRRSRSTRRPHVESLSRA